MWCVCLGTRVFGSVKEIAQDLSIPSSSFWVLFLLPRDQQTAVSGGAVPLRQLGNHSPALGGHP